MKIPSLEAHKQGAISVPHSYFKQQPLLSLQQNILKNKMYNHEKLKYDKYNYTWK